tara:strand:- start:3 stop:104 length:102 start_codon:yes stop_codon:yes gene_type:complete
MKSGGIKYATKKLKVAYGNTPQINIERLGKVAI